MKASTVVHACVTIAAIAALLWPLDVLPADATLTIYVLDGNGPTLVANGAPLAGQSEADPTATTFKVPLNGRLVSPLLLRVSPTDPNASIYPLRIETPLTWSNKTYEVRVKSSKATGTSDEVRAIYAKTIAASDRQLPILYIEARRIAAARVAALQDDWSQLHDYDVQAVFKLLEIIRELNRRFIAPGDDFSMFRSWLVDAVKQSPRRVKHAVGLVNAQKLLADIESLQGTRFVTLWSFVSNPETPCIRRGPLLQQFLSQFRSLASDDERIAVERTMRLTEGHMLSAIAQCEAIRARCVADAEVPQVIASLETLVTDIEQVRAAGDDPVVRTLLGNDLVTLGNLRTSLVNAEQRSCSDRNAWTG